MRYFFFLQLLMIFLSCTKPIDNLYSPKTLAHDIIDLEEFISIGDIHILVEYIDFKAATSDSIIGKSYYELLNEANRFNREIKLKEKLERNALLVDNVQKILEDRLSNHLCDDYILEMKKKGIHKHNDKKDNSLEMYEDSYLIDY